MHRSVHGSRHRRRGPSVASTPSSPLDSAARASPENGALSRKLLCVKAVAIASALGLLLYKYSGRFDQRGRSQGPTRQREYPRWERPSQPTPPRSALGCLVTSRERCLAGVYKDATTSDIFHLEAGGRAFLSPGTAAAEEAGGGCLWWKVDEDGLLELVDCDNRPLLWPGISGHLRRDSARPFELTAFAAQAGTPDGVASSPDAQQPLLKTDSLSERQVVLVRDPLGFVFPGSLYVLSFRPGLAAQDDQLVEVRVVLHLDGNVTDVVHGTRIAKWVFPETKLFPGGGETGVTGDALVLILETDDHQARAVREGMEGISDAQFEVSTFDGGRTWLADAHTPSSAGKDRGALELSLVVPTAVSMFPITAAISRGLAQLDADVADDNAPKDLSLTADGGKLQPIVEIFEAQPLRSDGHEDGVESMRVSAVIVITRAVLRPTQGNTRDLSCVINGFRTPALFLSWSMVLCSTRNVKPGEATLRVESQGKAFSVDYYFSHTPPPRHTRLAWPTTTTFNLPALGVPHKPATSEHLNVGRGTDVSDWSGQKRPGTTIAICTMFKNEAPYLREWLQYHRQLGVSKVYMYDNGSTDDSRQVLLEHVSSGFVEVRDWRHEGAQTEALNDCLCRFRHATMWMTFIDIDEFMDPVPSLPIPEAGHLRRGRVTGWDARFNDKGLDSMATRRIRLQEFLQGPARNRHTHCLPWVNYCSQNRRSKAAGGILENYLQVEEMGELKIHMQKPLFLASDALSLRRIGPHFLLYASEDIDTQYSRNLKCPYEWLDSSEFRLRHYRSKSQEEYVQRRVGADSAYRSKRYTRDKLALEWQETNALCREELT